MSTITERVAQHLLAARERNDALTRANRERPPTRTEVLEVLDRMLAVGLDQVADWQLRSELDAIQGLATGLVGEDAATAIIERLPDIRHCIALDLQAAFDGDPAARSLGEIVSAYPSCRAVSTHRIAHAFYQLGHPVVARIMSEEAHGRTGIDIHPGADIGCHFFIDHGTGVVIGETTLIGNGVKLYHGVTLGAFSNRGGRLDVNKKRHPTLEDDVTIYPNATILGGATVVGRHSVIGGNAWVTQSVPPNSRVVVEQRTPSLRDDSDRELEPPAS